MAKQDHLIAGRSEEPEDLAARLRKYRGRIDQLDKEIVRLLNDRARWALELGRCKSEAGLETYQPQREVAVLENARDENRGPLGAEAITRLFERIIDENRRLERLAEEE